MDPYQQYMYSYPHKTAYGTLEGICLTDYTDRLADQACSLYFHIPFCQSKCGYCNLFSVTGQNDAYIDQYLDAMEAHAEQMSEILPASMVFSDLTLGGGTPLMLSVMQLERVFCIAERQMGFAAGKNMVVVETSPAQTTEEKLNVLKEHHVTRLSMGVQSFYDAELKELNRSHTVEQVKRAMEVIVEVGFPCVNLDLIYGIPGQTEESFIASIDQALAYDPEELFIYPLYIKKDTYLSAKGVRRPESAAQMYCTARKYLRKKGYIPYSMRRFVKGGDTGHLSGCGFENTISIGCGGRSYIDELHFCTPYGVRQSRCREILDQYIREKDHLQVTHGYLLSEEEQKRRYIIKNILFACGLSRQEYQRHFGAEPVQEFPLLSRWIQKGYAREEGDRIRLSEMGFTLSDHLGPMLISDEVRQKMVSSDISPMLQTRTEGFI